MWSGSDSDRSVEGDTIAAQFVWAQRNGRRRDPWSDSENEFSRKKSRKKPDKKPSRYQQVQFDSSKNSKEKGHVEVKSNELHQGNSMKNRNSLLNSFVSTGSQIIQDEKPGIKNSTAASSASKPIESKIDSTHMKSYGIGAKLMGKMGYVPGKGLGSQGKGIVEPIQQNLRPTLLGLGGTTEAPKRKKQRMNDYESEKFSKRPKKHQKPIYKTLQELEDGGLKVPAGFKHIIDMTGGEEEFVEDLSKISISDEPVEMDSFDLYRRARSEVENYKKEWDLLQSRKISIRNESVESYYDRAVRMVEKAEKLQEIAKELEKIVQGDQPETMIKELSTCFKKVSELRCLADEIPYHDLVIAALNVALPKLLKNWNPLENQEFLHDEFFEQWNDVVFVSESELEDSGLEIIYTELTRTLFKKIWSPKVISFLNQHWTPEQSHAAEYFVETWKNLYHDGLQEIVESSIYQIILREIKEKPPSIKMANVIKTWCPHVWEPQQENLIQETKNGLSEYLRSWSPKDTNSTIQIIRTYSKVIGMEMMDLVIKQSLVPRVDEYLRRNLIVDVSNQNAPCLKHFVDICPIIHSSSIGKIMANQFFPKFIDVLYQKLVTTKDEELEEVSQWYQSWTGWLPYNMKHITSVLQEFKGCLDLINRALDLENRAELKKPEKTKAPMNYVEKTKMTDRYTRPTLTFYGFVQEKCAEHDLFVIKTRRVCSTNGRALYKISSDPDGTGGVTCYFEHDVAYVEDDYYEGVFKPAGVDELCELALER